MASWNIVDSSISVGVVAWDRLVAGCSVVLDSFVGCSRSLVGAFADRSSRGIGRRRVEEEAEVACRKRHCNSFGCCLMVPFATGSLLGFCLGAGSSCSWSDCPSSSTYSVALAASIQRVLAQLPSSSSLHHFAQPQRQFVVTMAHLRACSRVQASSLLSIQTHASSNPALSKNSVSCHSKSRTAISENVPGGEPASRRNSPSGSSSPTPGCWRFQRRLCLAAITRQNQRISAPHNCQTCHWWVWQEHCSQGLLRFLRQGLLIRSQKPAPSSPGSDISRWRCSQICGSCTQRPCRWWPDICSFGLVRTRTSSSSCFRTLLNLFTLWSGSDSFQTGPESNCGSCSRELCAQRFFLSLCSTCFRGSFEGLGSHTCASWVSPISNWQPSRWSQSGLNWGFRGTFGWHGWHSGLWSAPRHFDFWALKPAGVSDRRWWTQMLFIWPCIHTCSW